MAEVKSSYSLLSDANLVQLVKDGNDNAFDELVIRYLGTIGYIARRYSAEGYEQKDFVQEGLLGLLHSCRTFNPDAAASFKSYMSIVIERRFISIIRRSNARRSIPQSSLVQIDALSDEVEDTAPNPEELLMCSEHLNNTLCRLKSVLSKTEYDIIMLYGSGLSYKEIAKKLCISEKSVDNALQRARRKIKSAGRG